MARELRRPAPAAEFDRLTLPAGVRRLTVPWWNLRWATPGKPGPLFFATASGRLTPSSGRVPCLYLARDPETSFRELYGDALDGAAKQKVAPRFSRAELERRCFLQTIAPLSVRLYDLTAERSAQRIGLDLATLYSPEVEFPREFAQRLHDHPARFDGVRYVSRHTQTPCVVLWATHQPALSKLRLKEAYDLWSQAKFDRRGPPGTLRLFGSVIQVAAAASGS